MKQIHRQKSDAKKPFVWNQPDDDFFEFRFNGFIKKKRKRKKSLTIDHYFVRRCQGENVLFTYIAAFYSKHRISFSYGVSFLDFSGLFLLFYQNLRILKLFRQMRVMASVELIRDLMKAQLKTIIGIFSPFSTLRKNLVVRNHDGTLTGGHGWEKNYQNGGNNVRVAVNIQENKAGTWSEGHFTPLKIGEFFLVSRGKENFFG